MHNFGHMTVLAHLECLSLVTFSSFCYLCNSEHWQEPHQDVVVLFGLSALPPRGGDSHQTMVDIADPETNCQWLILPSQHFLFFFPLSALSIPYLCCSSSPGWPSVFSSLLLQPAQSLFFSTLLSWHRSLKKDHGAIRPREPTVLFVGREESPQWMYVVWLGHGSVKDPVP